MICQGRGASSRLADRGQCGLFVTVLVLAALLTPGVAGAAVFNVIGTSDGTGACVGSSCTTLRSAVLASNNAGGPNTINVPAGTYKLTLTPSGADDGMTGDLHITASVTIAGAGSGSTTIVGDGDRVFDISSGASAVTMSDVTISGGNGLGFGGAIQTVGSSLTLTHDVLTGNTASGTGFGGAIRMYPAGAGMLTISSSTFSSNIAGTSGNGVGGAIMFQPQGTGTASITDSTFDSNKAQSGTNHAPGYGGAGFGGAIMFEPTGTGTLTVDRSTLSSNISASSGPTFTAFGGAIMFEPRTDSSSLKITNSTFTGNRAEEGGSGGAIFFEPPGAESSGTLTHATIVGNSVGTAENGGGGITIEHAPVAVRNSIISGNTAGASANNCQVFSGSLATVGHNLEFGASCGFDIHADPMVAALADNGGPTQTMALVARSPAIDAGANTFCPATDQRGAPRPDDAGSACDLGAFEFGSTPPGGGTTGGGTTGAGTPLPPGGFAPPSHEPTHTLIVSNNYITLPDGSVVIKVTVGCDGSCTLTIGQTAAATAAKKRKRKPATLIQRITKTVRAKGTVTIKVRLKPTATARKIIKRKGKLKVRVRATLTQTGRTAASKIITVTFKKPRAAARPTRPARGPVGFTG